MTPFELFGAAHLLTLLIICLAVVGLGRVPARPNAGAIAWTIALLLLAQELLKQYYFNFVVGQPWTVSLPLDFCRINEFLCAYMLVRRSYRVFEIAYFWAICASGLAMLTPDLTYGFPDVRYLMFFLGHGLVVLAAVYALAAYGFRPTLRSVGRAIVVTLIYTVVIAGINLLLDSNYLFLRHRPEGASAMDYFGPWPVYIFVAAGFAVLLFFLAYLPFARHGASKAGAA